MFDIVTIEPKDAVVLKAVHTLTEGNAVIANPSGNYRFIARNACLAEGDGGTNKEILVIVGHASPDSISHCRTWQAFKQDVTVDVDWTTGKTSIYIAACSTAGEGTKFAYGNFANEIKAAFPNAVVWASNSAVDANDLSGDWQQV